MIEGEYYSLHVGQRQKTPMPIAIVHELLRSYSHVGQYKGWRSPAFGLLGSKVPKCYFAITVLGGAVVLRWSDKIPYVQPYFTKRHAKVII